MGIWSGVSPELVRSLADTLSELFRALPESLGFGFSGVCGLGPPLSSSSSGFKL